MFPAIFSLVIRSI